MTDQERTTEQGKKNIVWAVFAAFMVFGIGGLIANHKPWSREDEARTMQAQARKATNACYDEAVSASTSDVFRAVQIKERCDALKKLADAMGQ